MPTIKLFGCFVASCILSSVAWGQYDVPPSLPDFAAPPEPGASTFIPDLPQAPPAATTTVPARTPSIVGPRPQRLSPESTANLPKQVQNIIDFYGGATSARALAQLPQRPSSGDMRPAPPQPIVKPFEGTAAPPTISPYMNMYIDEGNEALPNYLTYVRPAIQQQQMNAMARQRLNSLQNQVRQVSYGEAVQQPGSGAVPGTGHGTRYFNTTQFYPTTRRLR